MENFREALSNSSLTDLGFTGQWFTWEWGQSRANNIKECLDREVKNVA